MGSTQSARKLTIVNEEDDVNVIKISDSIAKRLAQNAAELSAKPVVTQIVSPEPIPTATSVPSVTKIPQTQETIHHVPSHYTVSALAMQQQMEQELSEQEAYWKRRLQNLERVHEKINRAIEDEYKKAITIFDDSKVIKVQDSVKPCLENRQKVLKCYQDNPKETLRCADLVEQFSNCVDQRRAHLMKCN